jgi:hypothetical protein
MDDVADGGGAVDDRTVYVEMFGPCLRDVEFLPGRRLRNLCFHLFYSEDLARASLAHLRRRFPQARLEERRIPLNLNQARDLDEYGRHVAAARTESRCFRGGPARPGPARGRPG